MSVSIKEIEKCKEMLGSASDMAENYCKDIAVVKSVGASLFEMLIERVGEKDIQRVSEIKVMLEFMRGFTACLPSCDEEFSVSDLMIKAKDYISVMGLGPNAKMTTECSDDGCMLYGNMQLAYFILTTVLRNGLIYHHGRIAKVTSTVTPNNDDKTASVVIVVETSPSSGYSSQVRDALRLSGSHATSASVHMLKELCKFFDGDAVILERDDLTLARVELNIMRAEKKEG